MKHDFWTPVIVVAAALLVVLMGGCTGKATQKDEKSAHVDVTVRSAINRLTFRYISICRTD